MDKYSAAANDTLDVGTTDAPMATMMLGGTDDDFQKVGASLETLSAFVDGQTTSIGMALATRNLMDQLRSAGETTGGPKPFAPKDRSAFLQSLEREIVRLKRAGLS